MVVSQARIDANIRNAQKSTGPKTIEGKRASRANALTHGLCSSIIVPESPELVQQRAEEIFQTFKPYTDYQAWQVSRAAVITIRIDRVERIERRVRDKVCLQAELNWDDDRRLEAEVLGGMLPRKPAETVETLRRTPHGCEWLMTRWAMLAYAADTHPRAPLDRRADGPGPSTSWPRPMRSGRVTSRGPRSTFTGSWSTSADDSAAVARRMVDELMDRREVVRGLDEVNRALAEADLTHDNCDELRKLRRYESALHTKLRWTIGQMQFQGPEGKGDPALFPRLEGRFAPDGEARAQDPPTKWRPRPTTRPRPTRRSA